MKNTNPFENFTVEEIQEKLDKLLERIIEINEENE